MRFLINIIFFILCFVSAPIANAIPADIQVASQLAIIEENVDIISDINRENFVVLPSNQECEITASGTGKKPQINNSENKSNPASGLINLTPNVGEASFLTNTIHNKSSYLENEICIRAP